VNPKVQNSGRHVSNPVYLRGLAKTRYPYCLLFQGSGDTRIKHNEDDDDTVLRPQNHHLATTLFDEMEE